MGRQTNTCVFRHLKPASDTDLAAEAGMAAESDAGLKYKNTHDS